MATNIIYIKTARHYRPLMKEYSTSQRENLKPVEAPAFRYQYCKKNKERRDILSVYWVVIKKNLDCGRDQKISEFIWRTAEGSSKEKGYEVLVK